MLIENWGKVMAQILIDDNECLKGRSQEIINI